jgi:outer membrane lipoprotein SlyB
MRTRHLRLGLLALTAAVATGNVGCSTMNNTERGAIGGGVVGTALGTAVGAATGRPLAGAAFGAAAGTATGALLGNGADKEEKRDREIAQAVAVADAQAQAQRMGIADVIGLAQAGHSDTVIINQIRSTRSTFSLVPSDLDMLKNAGVSQRVIAEMQASRPAAPSPARVVVREAAPVVYEAPPAVVVRPAPVYVVGPPRPYGPYYGGAIYYGRRW